MSDDPAVRAATEALRDLFNLSPENLSEHGGNDETIAAVAVEAARPIIEAETRKAMTAKMRTHVEHANATAIERARLGDRSQTDG